MTINIANVITISGISIQTVFEVNLLDLIKFLIFLKILAWFIDKLSKSAIKIIKAIK